MSSTLLDKKIDYWEHQLLDLGKRNKMINYRETKRTTLRLVKPSFEELFQRLAISEETLTFQRSVDRETDVRVFSILSLLENLSSPLPVTIGDIKTEGSVLERQKTLKNMRSKARLSLEEQGTNILYLSFGFIEWRDGKGASAQWIKSPLILVPATLTLESLNSPYTLSKYEDDIVVNPTLQYYLKTDYGIELPAFDIDKDTLKGYLKSLEEIADQRGWRIIRDVSLGLLSFLKISMYNDLLQNEERIKNNPVIRAMSGDVDAANDIPDELRSFELDSVTTKDCYQVMSADSSQQDAILYSKNNISFVMQGPPGTGKSQTITNIIAEALADGKKVLFVSEKMAALQVVYRRLQDAHLADFCLPLHSYKANKKEILEQIGANLKLKQTRVKDTALNNLEELLAIRQELNSYAAELHQLNPKLNMSCYEVYSKLEEVKDAPSATFELDLPLTITQAQLQNYLKMLREYSLSLQRINYKVHGNPWEGLRSREAGFEYSNKLQQELRTMSEKTSFMLSNIRAIKECPKLPENITYASIPSLIDSIDLICELPAIPDNWLDEDTFVSLKTEAEKAINKYDHLFSLEKEIQTVFGSEIYTFNYNEWKEKLLTEANKASEVTFIEGETTDCIIENALPLQKKLESIHSYLTEACNAFESINDLLGIDIIANFPNQRNVLELANLIKDNAPLVSKWFTADIAKLKISIFEAKANSNKLHETKKCILDNWKYDALLLDYSPILLSLQEILISYSAEITNAEHVFEAINNLLGTNLTINALNLQSLSKLTTLIKGNDIIVGKWFDCNLISLKALATEAKEKAARLLEIKSAILENWESEALQLDYSPILLRYKTEYTGFFKLFNLKYHHDKKQIQALSRTVIKQLSDEMAVDLLTHLRDFHELDDWFDSKKEELYGSFSFCFDGITSNWNGILSAIETTEKIRLLPASLLSPKLIELLSKNHADTVSELEPLLSSAESAFIKARVALQAGKLEVNVDAADYDGAKSLSKTNMYLDRLGALHPRETSSPQINTAYGDEKGKLHSLSITAFTESYDEAVIELLIHLNEYHELVDWFEINKDDLSTELSTYYSGTESNWDAALSAVITVEKIRTLPADYISPTLIDLLSKHHPQLIASMEALTNTAGTALSQANNAIRVGIIEMNVDSANFDGVAVLPLVDDLIKQLIQIREQFNCIIPYAVDSKTQIETIYHIIEVLNVHKHLSDELDVDSTIHQQSFDFLFAGRNTDWPRILSLLQKTNEIKELSIFSELRTIVNLDSARKQEIKGISIDISNAYGTVRPAFEWICSQFNPEQMNTSMNLDSLADKVNECLDGLSILGGWIDYQEAKETCSKSELADFIYKVEKSDLYLSNIEKTFLKEFYHMWLGAICDRSVSVRRFRRNTQDERIEKFIELDDLQLLIDQMRIREKLIEKLPSGHRLLKATDEVAILQKELGKKRNIMPLRKLFKQIPNLLLKLKPCLMMSPLSVSYFLETEAYSFDLVIFDEASQIFPEDAIGAISRGSQVVIAGDSKQLPPTNFFSATTNNSDNEYDTSEEDDFSNVVSDSILEESASVLPNRTLLWHYRSKHEDLIAFSNREIYKNNLITFPNSVTKAPDMGVEYIYVENGYYEGGGKSCNVREAQKCVMLVLEHIQKHPDRSLGIIAFSEKQQTAIENAIVDFRERMPQYDWFFDENKDEPFFVKNLENVQGDERDTIIFSICYAKDRDGRMFMRFGPLGHEGGERRLNVAITRAKCNVKLVGSILPSDIDLNRTNSEGVRMLRAYIEFAKQGSRVLKPVKKEEDFETEDDFCKAIAEFLVKHGYKVQTEIGCSAYKIDIAIENPKVEGEYIAGIECDGLSYIQAKTARDRDHLRKTILQNMGWNLYRVWSTEWIRNPETEGRALLAFLESLENKEGKITHAVKNSNEDAVDVSIEQIASETTPIETAQTGNLYGFSLYREVNRRDVPSSDSYDNFTRIGEYIWHVVSVEQPIHMEMLYKRMGPFFTTGKATEGVKSTIDAVIKEKLAGQVEIDSDDFIRLLPKTPIVVRVPAEGDTPRPMEYIHTEEVAAAMKTIVEYSFGITAEDLATECARAFGYERKGPKIKQKTDAAIQYLKNIGAIRLIDGKVSLS